LAIAKRPSDIIEVQVFIMIGIVHTTISY
jgi:hypothetical protein